MNDMSQVPVTVLTGFLGAGKTTLLNHILTEQHGQKYAVIVNEFGEQGIDNDLVVDADEEVFEMNNGCICCTVRGDLIRILGGLMKRADKLDAIIVETTGLADPAPVAQTFFVDQDVSDRTKLDAIVTVADAVHLSSQLGEHHEAEEQIAFADVVLLNKIDLVDDKTVENVQTRIRKINPYAKIIKTNHCSAPLTEVLDPLGVAVLIDASHQCMTTRGVHKPESSTVTKRMLGVFKTDENVRSEFMELIR